jgi:hypothetical protein
MVTNGGRKNIDFAFDLTLAMDAMPYLLPVYQILAVKYGYSGKIFKGTVYQVIVVANTAHAWVGVKAGDDGVSISNFGCRIGCHYPRVGVNLLSKHLHANNDK